MNPLAHGIRFPPRQLLLLLLSFLAGSLIHVLLIGTLEILNDPTASFLPVTMYSFAYGLGIALAFNSLVGASLVAWTAVGAGLLGTVRWWTLPLRASLLLPIAPVLDLLAHVSGIYRYQPYANTFGDGVGMLSRIAASLIPSAFPVDLVISLGHRIYFSIVGLLVAQQCRAVGTPWGRSLFVGLGAVTGFHSLLALASPSNLPPEVILPWLVAASCVAWAGFLGLASVLALVRYKLPPKIEPCRD